MTAIELGRPLATRFVPSTGSTAMSTSRPPLPTSSPMKSIGASSRSPSPMTMRPEISISPSDSRIFSTAAPSAASRSPRPIQRDAASAALSVTFTKSRELTMPPALQGNRRFPLRNVAVSTRAHAPHPATRAPICKRSARCRPGAVCVRRACRVHARFLRVARAHRAASRRVPQRSRAAGSARRWHRRAHCGCGRATRATFLGAPAPRLRARCTTTRLRGRRSCCCG